MFLPVRVERVEWRRRPGTAVVCRVRNVQIQDVQWFADIDLFTPEGESVAALAGCCCVKKPQEAHVAGPAKRRFTAKSGRRSRGPTAASLRPSGS